MGCFLVANPMSRPSSPFRTPGATGSREVDDGVLINRTSMKNRLKSPQVLFQGPEKERAKHPRSTPSSGRGKLKRLKERISSKIAGQRFTKASPSHLVSRSMLSFDLHAGPLHEDEIPGDSELFVKFVKDRRGSTGRGSLKELINKRIALQVGAKALAVRQVAANPAPAEPSEKPKEKPAKPIRLKADKARSGSPKAQNAIQPNPYEQVKEGEVSRRASELLEVPLAQDDFPPESTCSQTQVFERPELSQTQVLQRTPLRPDSEPDLPFLPTPQVDVLEPVEEESESDCSSEVENAIKAKPKMKKVFNPFLDDEAEGSEDGSHGGSSDSESDSDLTDLIASSPEEEGSPTSHARLHAKWLREEEERLFDENRPPANDGEQKRRNRMKLRMPLPVFQPQIKKHVPKKKSEKIVEAANTVVEEKKEIKKPPPIARPKKFPHRRSSVSSACSELEVRVGTQILNQKERPSVTGPFAFIEKPDEDRLAKAAAKITAHEEATSKAMAGASKLMGKKRFAFGG